MNSTKLSTLLSRMDRFQTIANIEEQYKVRDLDDALRALSRETQTPWSSKKSTLRIFDDVLEYPIASDHDSLHYIDNQNLANKSQPARFFFTSLKEFYENPDYRNDMAEIWDNGTRFLGIRYGNFNFGTSQIDSASVVGNYSVSGDAGTPVLDEVFFKTNSSSIKIPVTLNTSVATINIAPSASYDANYKRKYLFVYIYLAAAPTSIDLKFGNDSNNYMTKNVTTQFSGQGFKAGDWNLVAMDLNAPDSTTGTIGTGTFNYESIILNGAATGNYYIGESSLKEWELMDYWYYSSYNVKTETSTVPDQDYFFNSAETYNLSDELVGDKEWADVITYDAILSGMEDEENSVLIGRIESKRKKAWDKLLENYPSERPLITNRKYSFETNYSNNSISTL